MNGKGMTLEAVGITKHFPGVPALTDVSLRVEPGEILCLLGDNGAGKSTLIKVLSGVHQPDAGRLELGGKPVHFRSPRDARDYGIATVFQDLAMIPLMPVVGNFFLGREPAVGWGPFRRVDWAAGEKIALAQLQRVGITLKSGSQPIGTLSGGQRQSVAIARAMYFGASVLILDEPTSALGVREARLVLRLMLKARADGLAIIFISHNVAHAASVGDRFTVLRHGSNYADVRKGEVSRDQLLGLMAGDESFTDEEEPDLDLELAAADESQHPDDTGQERLEDDLHQSMRSDAEELPPLRP
jgi:simple sugar transport system ATP-binding protein